MALEPKLSKQLTLSIDGDVIGFATDFDLEVNKEVIDITTLSAAGWKEFLVDLKEWKISYSGLVTRGTPGTNEIGSEGLLSSFIGSDAAVAIILKTSTTGDQYVTGNAFILSHKESGKVNDKMTFSGELQGTGALTLANVV